MGSGIIRSLDKSEQKKTVINFFTNTQLYCMLQDTKHTLFYPFHFSKLQNKVLNRFEHQKSNGLYRSFQFLHEITSQMDRAACYGVGKLCICFGQYGHKALGILLL